MFFSLNWWRLLLGRSNSDDTIDTFAMNDSGTVTCLDPLNSIDPHSVGSESQNQSPNLTGEWYGLVPNLTESESPDISRC